MTMFSRILLVFSLIFIYNSICYGNIENSVIVEIPQRNHTTTIVGIKAKAWNDEFFYNFRGIPYAKAPIDDLRFKDPIALHELPYNIDARYDGHDCPSIYATNASEDCLVLNIYTKNISSHAQLPVVIFIAPGGFYIGSGLSTYLGPEYLLSKEIVLVTFNYRLGTLGFLNLDTKDIPGNAGLKDQVQAIRWIQKYIENFGGNPNDVTLMGYSAGGLSVGLHLVSPMSQGLFHKAILMSGALPPQTQLPRGGQIDLAKRQAKILNCTLTETDATLKEDIIKCLHQYDGMEIAATLRSMFDFGKDNPIYLWLPIIEHDYGQERFLHADFYESLHLGDYKKVPLLIGYTDGEFCSSAASIIESNELESAFYQDFDRLAPIMFMYQGRNDTSDINALIKEHYLTFSEPHQTNFERLCDLFSDAIIRFGAYRISDAVAKHSEVYNYKFTYRGSFSHLNYPTKNPRVEHVDDLMYLFRMQPHFIHQEDADGKMVKLFTNFIYDFVKDGKFDGITFPQHYAVIDTEVLHRNGTNFNEVNFWQKILP